MMPAISVITPSMRVHRLGEYFETLFETTPRDAFEAITVIDANDLEACELALKYSDIVLFRRQREGAVSGWNDGAAIARGDYFLLGADDIRFRTGWYEAAMAAMDSLDGYGMVGFNDMSPNAEGRSTHFLISRDYAVDRLGGVLMPPVYDHNYTDWEVQKRAVRDGVYVWSEDARVEHEHVDWHKNVWDEVYEITREHLDDDRELYYRREAAGFPNNYRARFCK